MNRLYSTLILLFLSMAAHAQTLVWSDEFNYHGLPDSTKWGYEEGFVRNKEPQYYTVRRLENCRVDSGMLIIEARKEAWANAAYTSASLITLGKAAWQYGRIEVRAKVPAGAGSWPAIWLLGADRGRVQWPLCGEVDIMEYLGRDPSKVYGTAHYADSTDTYRHQGEAPTVDPPADGFHVYALQWYPDRMEWYYDSLRYFVFDLRKASRGAGKGNIYQKPFYLLLNLALGHQGSWAGPVDERALPMRYYIDYVRVYRNDSATLSSPDSTLKVMKRVADWQLEHWKDSGMKYTAWDWVNAVSYTGFFALGQTSGDTTYTGAVYRIGNGLGWKTGPSRTMADDYCVGQTYAQLYGEYKDPRILRPFRALADSMLRLPHTESLEWKDHVQLRQWAWCDALFMGPPGLAYLSTVTGDRRYLDMADSLWWKTTAYLFDPADSLYFRDSRYFGQREANGQPMFWSRGNGWVMAGLVRVLANMPEHYPDQPRFVGLYKKMAARIAALQQPDGAWHASLLDPGNFPGLETSGTGLYCYALAWGVNRGLLPADTYGPVVARAWRALVTAVQPDGRLGYVQQIGENPQATGASSTEAYGTGAFLLAGSEVYKMNGTYSDRRIVR